MIKNNYKNNFSTLDMERNNKEYKKKIQICYKSHHLYGRCWSIGTIILHSHHMVLTCHLCLTSLHSAEVCILFHQGHSHLLRSPREQTGTGSCSWQQHNAMEIFFPQLIKKKKKKESGTQPRKYERS